MHTKTYPAPALKRAGPVIA